LKQLITVLVLMVVAIGAALAVSLVDSGRHEAAAGGYNDLLLNCKIHRVATIIMLGCSSIPRDLLCSGFT
jgi:hypothetical protein